MLQVWEEDNFNLDSVTPIMEKSCLNWCNISERFSYSRTTLISLRKWIQSPEASYTEPPLAFNTWQDLKSLGLLKSPRGTRAGKYCKWKRGNHRALPHCVKYETCGDPRNIPVILNYERRPNRVPCLRPRTFISIKCSGCPSLPKITPKCLVLNTRSIAKNFAREQLENELSSNFIDLCFLSETWLRGDIDS